MHTRHYACWGFSSVQMMPHPRLPELTFQSGEVWGDVQKSAFFEDKKKPQLGDSVVDGTQGQALGKNQPWLVKVWAVELTAPYKSLQVLVGSVSYLFCHISYPSPQCSSNFSYTAFLLFLKESFCLRAFAVAVPSAGTTLLGAFSHSGLSLWLTQRVLPTPPSSEVAPFWKCSPSPGLQLIGLNNIWNDFTY